MQRGAIRFLSPQRVTVRASLERTVAELTRFGHTATRPGENHSEVLRHEGNVYRIRFTTHAGRRTFVTEEEVTVYPPNVVTYRHLSGPLDDVYEVFTAVVRSDHSTDVDYIGRYRHKRMDWPLIGWLLHRFAVRPAYDRLIAAHLRQVKRRAEAAQRDAVGVRATPVSAATPGAGTRPRPSRVTPAGTS